MRLKDLSVLIFLMSIFLQPSISLAQEGQSGPPSSGETLSQGGATGEGPATGKKAIEPAPSRQGKIPTGEPSPVPMEKGPEGEVPAEPQMTPPTEEMSPERVEEIQAEGAAREKVMRQPLQRFGRDFFTPARKRILEMEKRIIRGEIRLPSVEQRDALSGFVGPLEMVTSPVYATVPHRYVLTPGDQVTVFYWGTMLDLQKVTLVLDENGEVAIPKVGKIVARGMTLDQFRGTLKSLIRRVTVKDIELIATLDRLKSMQIFMTGEAFRPGSYAVSAVTTLFNALYASGGPTDLGSLRDIRLLRNQQTIRIDFYDYLLRGDSHNDLPLQAGDTIFIPPIERSVSIIGEIVRPGIYELKNGENLTVLIDLAGEFKATAILQKIRIITLSPNKERIILEVDMTGGKPSPDPSLYDGDSVTVHPVLPEIVNMVTLEGKVERPGVYELKEGMRVSDLFSDINRPLGEAYMERADIIRLNEDLITTTLIPFHLGEALEMDPEENIELAWMDKVIVYSKFEVEFFPPRVVTIFGAVQRPDQYVRSDGMRLKDLIFASGGPLPGFYEKMEVARAETEGEVAILTINLERLLNGDETQNILLEDQDIVMVKKKSEFFDKPLFVAIEGEVKYAGSYALRTRTDRVSDLLKRAGGLTELAYPKGTVFTRKREHIPSKEQQTDLASVNKIINFVNDLEYERQLAKNRYLFIKEQEALVETPIGATPPPIVSTGDPAEAAAIGLAPATAAAAGATVGGAIEAMERLPSVVSEPRKFGDTELQPSERIIVGMPEAVSHPGGKEDLILMQGDTIKIPSRPTTVSVIGAVMRPTIIVHVHKVKLDHYINLAGGYTEDANKEKALVLRMDGSILPVDKAKTIEEGDIVYVPPKVMSLEVVERIDKIIDVVKFTLATAASVAVFIFLVGLFV